jgi:hypothetical protein
LGWIANTTLSPVVHEQNYSTKCAATMSQLT